MKHQMLRQVCHLVGLREFSDAHLPDTRKRGDSDQSDYVMIDALESLRSEVDLEKGADGNDETDEHAEIETNLGKSLSRW